MSGYDPTFIRKFGVRCDVKWMLKSDKDEFLNAMDNDDNHLRQDYRSLADVLGISNNKLVQLTQQCRDRQESVTERIIQEWRQTTGNRLTFQMMLTLLRHPGLVANETAARCIEKSLEACGHKVGSNKRQFTFLFKQLHPPYQCSFLIEVIPVIDYPPS